MPDLDDGAARLRSGVSLWQAVRGEADRLQSVNARPGMRLKADVVVIGAGITGAFIAERLTREGRTVVVIDRREPTTGSTTASTAMLQWELDASLLELEDRLGFDAAARICQDGIRAVQTIGALAERLGATCGFKAAESVFLSGDVLDASDLREECRLRERAGARSVFLGGEALALRGLQGDGALLSTGAAMADPVALADGLLRAAVARGAVLLKATASAYEKTADGVVVSMSESAVAEGRTLVLANGYELPDFVHAPQHSIISTWAIATAPIAKSEAAESQLVWEAADPYLYFRPGPGGRMIAGGEDVDTTDAETRDALTEAKAAAILRKLQARAPWLQRAELEFAWAGLFGETDDSLPLIGRVPGYPHAYAAFGYGGNGIAFSAIAADMLSDDLAGRAHPSARLYALDRRV